MQLGTPIQLFPTFGEFCEQAREFPHVLPHKFTASLEGYYQIFGDQAFVLTTRFLNPDLPFYEYAYGIGEAFERTVYPYFEKAIPSYSAEYYAIRQLMSQFHPIIALDVIRSQLNYTDTQMTISYLEAAADRLLALKTPTPLRTPARTPLQAVPPYTTLSERAAAYVSDSTTIQIRPVPAIVNEIKARAITVPEVTYPRLGNLEATVLHAVEPTTVEAQV